jgi:hypothetical protein
MANTQLSQSFAGALCRRCAKFVTGRARAIDPLLGRRTLGAHASRLAVGLGICLSLMFSSCATNKALRKASIAWDGSTVHPRPPECDSVYANTDGLIWKELNNPNTSVDSREKLNRNVDNVIAPGLNDPNSETWKCWMTSYEDHQHLPPSPTSEASAVAADHAYDLLVAEFDDQGERTDVSMDHVGFEKSEVALIEARLGQLLSEEVNPRKNGGLNIVVFTHGWHGNASATNDYSIWFKSILEQVTSLEATSRRAVCHSNRQSLAATPDSAVQVRLRDRLASYTCPSSGPKDTREFANRRTVGIEIAWRGDSEDIPVLVYGNFWDRKSAAQILVRGAVHDLMARLHKFYLSHSCHGADTSTTPGGESCDAVHLLTVGHSFGALIDYAELNDDLSTGILGDSKSRAYGFGDLTVLLNPAFEGERETTLIEAGATRPPYPTEPESSDKSPQSDTRKWPPSAQMPMLVTLQSKGDWATHYAFPFARFFTGFFENTPGAGEYSRSLQAVGWVEPYNTHELDPGKAGAKDNCDFAGGPQNWFCPFDLDHEGTQAHPLTLKWQSKIDRPPYFPLWTVSVDRSIMRNHDDISNPVVIRFVAQMFRAAYEQEELLHESPPDGGHK